LEVIIGLGHTKVILKFSILTVSLSIFFSYALIFGRFGLPDLGITGAGYAVTISNWITLFVLIIYLWSYKHYHLYFSRLLTSDKKSYYWELIKIGTPMGLMFCIEVGFFFVLTLLMGALGKDNLLAANQVTMQFMGTLMTVIFSIAQAITVRMGHLLGAGKIKAANKTAIIGIILSSTLMLAVSVVFWFKPEALIAIDFDLTNPNNNEIISYAIGLFAISALFQIVESARISLFGALRALKDTRFTLLTSICSFWFIALPLGYSMAYYFNLAGKGFWWGMVIGASFSVAVLFLRLIYKIKNFSFKEKSLL
ncbi:TPA: MATE family efflux transporter, partial [Legionella pneumophila]